MGCASNKEVVDPSDPKWKKWVVAPEINVDRWIEQVKKLPPPEEGYWRQFIVVVRHGHRQDRENRQEWLASQDSKSYPYDCRLTEKGVSTAKEVGETCKKLSDIANFGLVVSSPYIRCVETALEIAAEVDTPILLDREFGEIFDEVYMPDANGKVQYRDTKTITEIVDKKKPNNKFLRDEGGNVRIYGKQPSFPEPMIDAQLRFLERFETTAVKAIERNHGLIVVTHGDCVMVLLALLCQYAEVLQTDYCAYFFLYRDVKLPDKGEPMWKEKLWKKAEDTSVFASEWSSKIGPIVQWKQKPASENPFKSVEADKNFSEAKDQTLDMVGDYRRNNKKDKQLWTMSPAVALGAQGKYAPGDGGEDDAYDMDRQNVKTMTRSMINAKDTLKKELENIKRQSMAENVGASDATPAVVAT